jgi:hypothetical protein
MHKILSVGISALPVLAVGFSVGSAILHGGGGHGVISAVIMAKDSILRGGGGHGIITRL